MKQSNERLARDHFRDIGEDVQYWSRHLEERKRGASMGDLEGRPPQAGGTASAKALRQEQA